MSKISKAIRTDAGAKRESQPIFSRLGLDMYQVIRNQRLPFEVMLDISNAVI